MATMVTTAIEAPNAMYSSVSLADEDEPVVLNAPSSRSNTTVPDRATIPK